MYFYCMIQKKEFVIANPGSKDFLCDCTFPETDKQLPLVIFCHGYKGFKDWGAWNLVAESFAQSGFYFAKFNFSHNGTTLQNPVDFDDLEAFGNNNFSKELEDVDRVLETLPDNPRIDSEKIAIIGHSRGGGIAIIKDNEDERINALVTWAGISDFKRFFPQNLEAWKEQGVFYAENKRTHQQMPHYYQFYEDYILHEEQYNIQKAAEQLQKPYLIIHGADDESVNPEEATLLQSWSKHATLQYIEGAGHTFGATHPWHEKQLPTYLQQATHISIQFLKDLWK